MNTADLTRFAFSTAYPISQDDVRDAMFELMGRKPKRPPAQPGTPKAPPKPYAPQDRRMNANERAIMQSLRDHGPMPKETLQGYLPASMYNLNRACLRLRERGCIAGTRSVARRGYVWKITSAGRKALETGFVPPIPATSYLSRVKKQVQA